MSKMWANKGCAAQLGLWVEQRVEIQLHITLMVTSRGKQKKRLLRRDLQNSRTSSQAQGDREKGAGQ